MNIRVAEKRDLAQLDACMQELLKFESRFDDNLDPTAVIRDNYAPLIERDEWRIFVAEEGDEIAGYCAGCVFDGFTRKKPIALLDALYVKKAYRGRRCATRLIREFFSFAEARNAGQVELNVLSGNEAAHRLYTSLGFTEFEAKLRRPLY